MGPLRRSRLCAVATATVLSSSIPAPSLCIVTEPFMANKKITETLLVVSINPVRSHHVVPPGEFAVALHASEGLLPSIWSNVSNKPLQCLEVYHTRSLMTLKVL